MLEDGVAGDRLAVGVIFKDPLMASTPVSESRFAFNGMKGIFIC